MASWQVWALMSAAFAALTAIFAQLGVEQINPDAATLIRSTYGVSRARRPCDRGVLVVLLLARAAHRRRRPRGATRCLIRWL
jgi:hypothetical protein